MRVQYRVARLRFGSRGFDRKWGTVDWLHTRKQLIETSLRTRFLTGLVIVLPAALSLYIFYRIFDFFDSFFDPIVQQIFGHRVPGLGVVLLILIILFVGTIATNVLGNRILRFLETTMARIPVFKKLYAALKTVMDSFSPNGSKGFKKVVLAEYPKEGVYTMGFLTGWVHLGDRPEQYASVFFPSNNLYIGVQSFIPAERTLVTALSIEEGMRIILSGGLSMLPVLPLEKPGESAPPVHDVHSEGFHDL
ncbi:MAG: DUF502 domain-containing protein [Leptospirales bacterium]